MSVSGSESGSKNNGCENEPCPAGVSTVSTVSFMSVSGISCISSNDWSMMSMLSSCVSSSLGRFLGVSGTKFFDSAK